MVAITGTGSLTVSSPTVAGSSKRGIRGSGSLQAGRPTIAAVTLVPDNTSWDTDNVPWGQANFVYSEERPVFPVGNEFFQVDSGGLNFGMIPQGNPPVLTLVSTIVSLVRVGLTITGRDRYGNWKIDPGVVKKVTGLWPIFKGTRGTVVQVSVGFQERPDDPVTWQGPRNFVIGTDTFIDFDNVAGQYIAVKFESTNQESWTLLSYDLDLEDVGTR